MEYAHSYLESPVGILRISCTDTHVASIKFIEKSEEQLTVPGNELSVQTTLQLQEYFSGNRRVFSLPLEQSGSAFQEKVWQLLQQIPFGKTISYTTLSKQYGDVKAIRAVAAANGKNKLAIICPCHRVIGSNNSLTGYAGGLWRKQWLLAHEAKHFAGVQEINFENTAAVKGQK